MEQQPIAESAPAQSTPDPVDSSSALASLSQDERRAYESTGVFPEAKVPGAAPAGEDAPAIDAKGQPVPGPDGKPLSKRQQAANDKIREAVEKGIATERARAEAAERRLAEFEAKGKTGEPAKPAEKPAAAAEDKEPTLDDFLDQPDPYLALSRALVKYDLAQAKKADAAEREQATRADQAQQGIQKLFTTYQERETAFKATVPDFDAKTEAVRHQLDVRSPLVGALLDSPVAPQLILHLADNPADFERIGRLGTVNLPAALRELGKLEAKYEAAAAPAPADTPAPKVVTSAPKPATTLGSRAADPADEVQGAVARKDFRAYEAEANRREMASTRR